MNSMRLLKLGMALLCTAFVCSFPGEVLAARSAADLCYGCHGQLRKEFAKKTVHDPVRKGRCTACHDPHTSNQDKFLKDRVNNLCLGCHTKLAQEMTRGHVHSLLLRDKCIACHNPHATALDKLLAKEPNTLCLDCHDSVKKQLAFAYPLPPFKEGKCLSCHRPHVAAEEGLVRERSNQLCQACHGIKCKHKGVSLAFALKKADCTDCHNPHASEKKGVFNSVAHKAFVSQDCEQCHDSIVEGKPLTTKLPGQALCFSCHADAKKMLTKAYVHANSGAKSCTTCHNPHAARQKNLVWKNERWLCVSCHSDTERRQKSSLDKQKGTKCTAVIQGKCSQCHEPHAADGPRYLKGDGVDVCAACHTREHSISHPLRDKAIDPRTNQPMYCTTCHGIHSAENKFLLYFDRKKELCIQCHKKE